MTAVLENMNSKAMTASNAYPPLAPGKLRLYSMRFCPFAERTVLTLALKDIPCEVVNINLRQKPDWFTARNPTGTVPTLERDDMVLYESPVTCEWLDAVYPNSTPILPADPTARAKQKIIVERLSGVIGLWYPMLKQAPTPENVDKLKNLLKLAEELLGSADYFNGNSVGWADIMLWPVFERLPVLDVAHAGMDIMTHIETSLPKLAAYCVRMRTHPKLAKHLRTKDEMNDFLMGKDGFSYPDNPNYDFGL